MMQQAAFAQLQDQLPSLPWAETTEDADQHPLWIAQGPPPKSLSLASWEDLQALLLACQDHPLPLYSQPGPTPPSSDGLWVRMQRPQEPLPMHIDKDAMLLHCDGRASLEETESYARTMSFTTGFRSGFNTDLLSWISHGAPIYTSHGLGSLSDLLFSMTVLLPNGHSALLGRAPRSAAGPDLRGLFWGTLGAFGVPTKLSLRLLRHPSQLSFSQLSFSQPQDAFALLQSFAREQQIPLQTTVSITPQTLQSSVCLKIDPSQTPYPHQRLLELSPSREYVPCAPNIAPKHPTWLACSTWWSQLQPLLLQVQKHSPWEIETIHLTQIGHEGGVLLFQFTPPHDPPSARASLLSLIQTLQKQGPGRRFWSDPRWLSPALLDPANAEILRRIKHNTDPHDILNPHILQGA